MQTCGSPSCSTCVSLAAVSSEGLNQESRMRSVAPFLYEENLLVVMSKLYDWCMKVDIYALNDFLACAGERLVQDRRCNGAFLRKQGFRLVLGLGSEGKK